MSPKIAYYKVPMPMATAIRLTVPSSKPFGGACLGRMHLGSDDFVFITCNEFRSQRHALTQHSTLEIAAISHATLGEAVDEPWSYVSLGPFTRNHPWSDLTV